MAARARRSTTVALCAACLAMAGCTTIHVPEGASPGVRVRHPVAPQAKIRYNTVVILDKSLQDWHRPSDPRLRVAKIAVEKTDSNRTRTGTLEAWATLRNRTDHALQIEGRTTFFDKSEDMLEQSSWQRVYLPPQGVVRYSGMSTHDKTIAYYYIEIREGR